MSQTQPGDHSAEGGDQHCKGRGAGAATRSPARGERCLLWENQHAKQKKNRDTREGGKILLELGVHRCFSNATFRPRRLPTGTSHLREGAERER